VKEKLKPLEPLASEKITQLSNEEFAKLIQFLSKL